MPFNVENIDCVGQAVVQSAFESQFIVVGAIRLVGLRLCTLPEESFSGIRILPTGA